MLSDKRLVADELSDFGDVVSVITSPALGLNDAISVSPYDLMDNR